MVVCEFVQDDALEMCGTNVSNGKCEHMQAICDWLAGFRSYAAEFRILKAFLALSSDVSDYKNVHKVVATLRKHEGN